MALYCNNYLSFLYVGTSSSPIKSVMACSSGIHNCFRCISLKSPMATLPFRLDEEGVGWVLFSAESGVVKPLSAIIVDTGITVKVPRGYYGRICHRAGLHMETVTVIVYCNVDIFD